MQFTDIFDKLDLFAIWYFLASWLVFSIVTDISRLKTRSISHSMNQQRRKWMQVMAGRELRMVDTSIIAGLQHGTAFFASSCLLAIGGCFALMGSIGQLTEMYHEFDAFKDILSANLEIKLLGLTAIFGYSFFKFGWAYRLFNYCSIIIGATPQGEDADKQEIADQIEKASELNILGGKHFNSGLRGIFFGLGYIGWFVGPLMFVASTTLVVAVMIRRQFFSKATATVQT
ncbi:MAG: DUF599 family protein [Rhizobiaceae bacterium]